jgi:hypothetical protein
MTPRERPPTASRAVMRRRPRACASSIARLLRRSALAGGAQVRRSHRRPSTRCIRPSRGRLPAGPILAREGARTCSLGAGLRLRSSTWFARTISVRRSRPAPEMATAVFDRAAHTIHIRLTPRPGIFVAASGPTNRCSIDAPDRCSGAALSTVQDQLALASEPRTVESRR